VDGEDPTAVIRAFDFHAEPLEAMQALYPFFVTAEQEFWPGRDPVPFNEKAWRMRSPFRKRQDWVAEEGGEIIAHAQVGFGLVETNRHAANGGIYVRPDRRRRGLATTLFGEILAEARRNERSLLILNSASQVPAGEAFIVHQGAEMSLENRINHLDIARLDRKMVADWIVAGRDKAKGFSLGFWIDTLPEAELDAIATLFDTMNSAPRGSLDIEDHKITPEQLRQGMRELATGRWSRWTLYAREDATGRFAGFTDVFWHPDRPKILNQGNTGVLPAYRGHGLGRLLKATMLDRVLRERPMVRTVETGNADSNAPMLKINDELGFRVHAMNRVWQLKI
jgi:mycothiol synthase